MSLRRPVLALLTAAALVLSGCSGSSSSGSPDSSVTSIDPTSLVVDGEVDPDALDALVAEIDALEPAEVDRRASEASRELELALYDASGLTEAIGGEEASATSVEETAAWLAELAAESEGRAGEPTARVSPFRAPPRGRQLEAFATGMWGAFQVGALDSRGASEMVAGGDGKAADTKSGTSTRTSTGTEGTVSSAATNTDSSGVTTELKTTSTVACPDADGTFRASARADISSLGPDGRSGKRGSMSVEVIGTVGDAAQLLSYDTTYVGEMADFGAGRGSYVEMRGTRSSDGRQTAAVTRSSGAAEASITFFSALLAAAAEKYFGDELLAGRRGCGSPGCA